jgi:hypothetical protein
MANPTTEAPVFYRTPDGVERRVRYHLGAEKRIIDHFGIGIKAALDKYDKAALPALLYYCMLERGGAVPEGLDLIDFEESVDPKEAAGMMAALLAAFSKGTVSKNELEALIQKRMDQQIQALTGFVSGLSQDSASESPTMTSGGSLQPSSEPSPIGGENSSEQPTGASV